MKAYHFLMDDMTGGYGDEPAWKEGEERSVEGKLIMCQWGYHASPTCYDALRYARGSIICIVELSGEIIKDIDKYVARTRKLIKAVNAEGVLRTWTYDCAERALRRAKVKDERIWNAIKVARLYREGKATKEGLHAACATAWDTAAWDAQDVASDATDAAASAAWDTAASDAWDGMCAAIRAAAWDAQDVASDAEAKWQKRRLNKLMKELLESK